MRPLFAQFVDDAAMFPPGNASAAAAIAAHCEYRQGPWNEFVGPLLIPAAKWDQFTTAHQEAGSPIIAINVLGDHQTPPGLPDAVQVAGYEYALAAPPVPQPESGRRSAVEITADEGGMKVLDAIAAARAHTADIQAKFRTGGTQATAFPDEATLARVIIEAARRKVPLKFTAGLHHAVRHTAPETGFEHHGFLNVMLATHHAIEAPEDSTAVTVALAERNAGALTRHIEALEIDQQVALRTQFTSFGCCGVGDPIGDLVKLGLISKDYA